MVPPTERWRVTPEAEHVLDWFHIAIRLTVLEQFARGVAHHDAEGAHLLRELERAKWLLWHGNGHRARQYADDLRDDVKALTLDYPLDQLRRAVPVG